MPKTPVVFFKDVDGSVPLLEWFDELPAKVQAKCLLRIVARKEMFDADPRKHTFEE